MSKNSKEVNARYDAKRAGQRTRNWTLIFYPENLPEDWREQVDELRIKWIESPVHDRDETQTEHLKRHIYIRFLCLMG